MQEQFSALHKAARDFAAAGIPIFPCVERGKQPACANGFHDATTDLARIDAWWAENPQYNIALCPEDAGWCVVDIDPGAEPIDTPATYTVSTPRDGEHRYYAGSGPTTASKLAKHVDTRGIGGYILVPPSRVVDAEKGIDGTYRVKHETDLAPFPQELAARLSVANSKVSAAVSALDLPGSIERARRLLVDCVRAGDVAISGQGGNDRTYRLACEVQNLGLTPDCAFDLIKELWNPDCVPPWSDDELRGVIDNASHYSQNEAGAWAVAPASEVFSPATLDRVAAEAKTQEPRSKFYFEDEAEMEQGKDPKWIIPELIPEATTILLFGQKGSYKSFIAQEILMSVAAKVSTFGTMPALTGPTFYGALEGRNAIKKARRHAWKLARSVDEIPDFYVGRAPIIGAEGEMQMFGDAVVERLQGRKPRLIVLDTISKCMTGLNENDAGDAGRFIKFCDSLVEAFGCSVIAIGHSGKDEGRGHRGSSAFPAGFDTVIETKAHRNTKTVSVRVHNHKDAPEPELPWTFEGREIAGSLVFSPIDGEAFHELTKPDDTYDRKKVGKALQELNAHGGEQAVTTFVLAAAVIPPRAETEGQEAYDERQGRAGRALSTLAKTKLEAYCARVGRDLMWSLPS